ncbi:MAG: hypothetical protein OMM_04421 [Candidatus Magnetoglobus multicellularis str. Araruama]|uniref:Tape measure protein N-terminal domain-containing protein n=1 Tax=Candidatus Magnetoglobus multicellularis str. Araruama TaxID=890399 RepID=A0A1V1P1C3_9BACT|nr:MAG: hypothetical protein OMM_04421 [Candidatus Magnetoglobus multicellularis str. Araruama]
MAMRVETRFTARDQSLNKVIKNNTRAMTLFGKRTEAAFNRASRSGRGFGDVMKGVLGAAIVQRGIGLLKEGLIGVVNATRQIEDATASFTPLMGSAEKAAKLVARLNKEAATTPFQFEGIASVAKQLLPSMNGDIERTAETFRMLGDTAGGNIQKLESITRGFNKALLKGKPDMEALNMIAEAGVPIFQEMAKTMGVSKAQLFEMSKQGKLTNAALEQTFKNMTAEGGIFYKGMEIASQTLSGKISTLKDTISITAGTLGQEFLPQMKQGIDKVIAITQATGDWLIENKELIMKMFKFLGLLIKFSPVIIGLIAAWKAYAAVQAIVNALAAANPIGLIIIAIGILIGLIVVAIRHWDEFGAAMMFILNFMIPGLGTVISLVKTFASRWDEVTAAFKNGGILEGLKMIGKVFLDAVLFPFQQFLGLLAKIPGVDKFIKPAVTALENFREKGLGAEIKNTNNIEAPNQKQAASQNGRFQADINFSNMPSGTSINTRKSGSQPINFNGLGAN